ncbi:MAG: zf-HC2 domain-containing protein [Anaerolinea sp.]|nr:zf-HC2 domain-containing protein [Anaerolinea sp.]
MAHIELDLLAYLDGELNPAEMQSAEAHIAGCPACAAELVELQRLRAGLSTTVPLVYDSVRLPVAAETRIRRSLAAERARQARGGAPQAGLAGLWAGLAALFRPLSKAAIPLALVFFFGATLSAARLPISSGAQQTLVLGQDTLAPGSQAALRVVVNNAADSQPVANAKIDVQMRQAGLARTLFSGETDATGSAPVQFQAPADWEGDAELVVATASDLGQNEIVAPIQLQRAYRLLLSSDKPVYQPGETIHLRTLALGTVDGLPASGAVTRLEVFDSAGRPMLSQEQQSSEFGIAATDLPLAMDAPLGQYQLRATLGDTVSQLSVTLGEAPLPSFLVTVQADAPFYLPGDLVNGRVNALYFFGRPVAGQPVALRLVGQRLGQDPAAGAEQLFVQELSGETDDAGNFPFQFQLPELPADIFDANSAVELNLEATVMDAAGESQFGWQSLALAQQPILIAVTPEDGTLRTGVENVLYVLTSYPDGRPAATTLAVQIGSGALIEETTNEFGLAEVRFTPRSGAEGDREVTVTAADADGLTGAAAVVLPLDDSLQTLLLRTDRALYRVGDTMAVEAIATGSGPAVFLDVIKGGQTLLTQSALVENGKATLAVDLTPALAGTLELNAYQITGDEQILRDTRVALVEEAEAIQVELATDQSQYRPGQEARLSVRTTAEEEGVQTAVGLAVVNEAVYGLRQYQPGFTRAYFLLDQALPGAAGADLAALQAAQQLTAKASWANYGGRDYSLAAQSTAQSGQGAANAARQQAFSLLGRGISLALLLAAVLATAIILAGLRRSGVLGHALGRLLLTLMVLAVIGAGLIFLTQSVIDGLPAQGIWLLLAVVGLLWLALWSALLVYGWRRGDQRMQYVTLLLLAYMALLALLAFAAGQGAELAAVWLVALALSFGVLLAALLLFGWGLRQEGQKRAGLGVLALALLLMPLVVALNAADFHGSDMLQRVMGPPVYGLGHGLLIGCAAPPAPLSQPAPLDSAAGSAAPAAAPQPEAAAAPAAPAEMQSFSAPEESSVESAPEAAPLAAFVEESATAGIQEALAGSGAAEETSPPEVAALSEITATLTSELDLLRAMTPMVEVAPTPSVATVPAIATASPDEPVAVAASALITSTMTPTASPTPTPSRIVASATITGTTTPTATPTATLLSREAVVATQIQGGTPTAQPVGTRAPAASPMPALEPTASPTPEPTDTPTPEPADTPTPEPTDTPTPEPTDTPTPEPTGTPTPQPTAAAEPEPAASSAPPEATAEPTVVAPAAAKAAGPVEIPLESLPIIRERFPQTLYWNPEIVTDVAGRLTVALPTGETITTWRINALAVDRSGRLGSASMPLVVFQPLFLRSNLPGRMTVGEQFDAQIQIFNYSREAQQVQLSAQASAGLYVTLGQTALTVPANDVVTLPARVQAISAGQQTILLTLSGAGVLDTQQATILVQ